MNPTGHMVSHHDYAEHMRVTFAQGWGLIRSSAKELAKKLKPRHRLERSARCSATHARLFAERMAALCSARTT